MKVYLEVYGCTANKSDASLVKGILKENKYEIVDNLEDADFIIIHTCTVINKTEQRMLSRLRVFKKTGKKTIVGGCMASVQTDLIKSILPKAILLPPQYSHQVLDILENKKTKFIDKNKTQFSKYYQDIFAPVAIAEGCMLTCSYCITSIARGKLRSFPINEIAENICSAIKQGCLEIQLTAQDTSSYGLDSGHDLGELLKNISRIEGDFRIRVGMMNPYTCAKNIDSIIDGFNDPKIYKFLHIPVQSGDNNILEKMNRKYKVEDFISIIKKFRDKYKDLTISTDIIVGFPTETNEQFQHSINLLKMIKPDVTNITKYSARPYTKAKVMKGRINTEIVKERSRKLSIICDEISKENNLKYIGKKFTVLVTEKGKKNTYFGRTINYKPIVLKNKTEIGKVFQVEIIEAESTFLLGSII
jgi:threonylcarbamoyladenosine tRNA methylthiotransferase CDKAL1